VRFAFAAAHADAADWRERWPQNRVRRGSRCCSCAQFDLQFPSRERARRAKISRIKAVRSSTLQPKTFFQVGGFARGQFIIENDRVDIASCGQNSSEFRRFAGADESAGDWRLKFLRAVRPPTVPPALAANS